ncbi:MAG TPA: DNA methyltransferase [Chloroflexota bacterium]|nr:DNA methyltransferase [Chloroflexota bacterium]
MASDLRNRVVGLRHIRAAELLPNRRNFRTHPKHQRDALSGLLAEIGIANALIAYETPKGLQLIDGHLRKDAAPDALWPVLVLDVDEAEAATLLATLDPLAALAGIDSERLAALLTDVQTDDMAVRALIDGLAQTAGIAGSGGAPIEDVAPQFDRAEELRAQYGVEAGHLWQLGNHRLLCGDSTDAASVAALLGDVQPPTVVFDPPYDADPALLALRWSCTDALVFTDHRHTLDCIGGWPAFRCLFAWDGLTSWYTPSWPLARGKFCLWFGESAYNSEGSHYGEPDTAHTVSNTRGTYDYQPDPRGKHLSTVFAAPATQQFAGHAHAKPTDWIRLLVANCSAGAVFDPFAGSGTTLVACEQLGRTCYALEREPATVAVILQRMADLGITPARVRSTELT